MFYLHGIWMAHCDFKPKNVVVSTPSFSHFVNQYCVKLVNFGLSNTNIEASKSYTMSKFGIGTTMYRPPELYRKAHLEGNKTKTDWFKADVFSFAITCAKILSRQVRFETVARCILYKEVMKGVWLEIPATCPEDFFALRNDCCSSFSNLRPNCDSICAKLEKIRHNPLRELPTLIKEVQMTKPLE